MELNSPSFSSASLSSGVEITVQTLTIVSCPPAARYLPSLLNSIAHIASVAPLDAPPFEGASYVDFLKSSWARNTRLKWRSWLSRDLTLIYLGGGGNCGVCPIG